MPLDALVFPYLTGLDGRTVRIPTDRSWGWAPAVLCVVWGAGSAFLLVAGVAPAGLSTWLVWCSLAMAVWGFVLAVRSLLDRRPALVISDERLLAPRDGLDVPWADLQVAWFDDRYRRNRHNYLLRIAVSDSALAGLEASGVRTDRIDGRSWVTIDRPMEDLEALAAWLNRKAAKARSE